MTHRATQTTTHAQAFNLNDAWHMLHSHVHGTGGPTLATKEQFSDFGRLAETLTSMAGDLDLMGRGLRMYLLMLPEAADALGLQMHDVQAISGSLWPLQRELERHVRTLKAAVAPAGE